MYAPSSHANVIWRLFLCVSINNYGITRLESNLVDLTSLITSMIPVYIIAVVTINTALWSTGVFYLSAYIIRLCEERNLNFRTKFYFYTLLNVYFYRIRSFVSAVYKSSVPSYQRLLVIEAPNGA